MNKSPAGLTLFTPLLGFSKNVYDVISHPLRANADGKETEEEVVRYNI